MSGEPDMSGRIDRHREGVLGWGLRRRLLISFLVLSLLPLFGSNGLGYLRSRGILEAIAERYLGGVADLQAAQVEERVDQHLLYLEAVANGNRFLQAAAERSGPTANPGMSDAASPAAVSEYLARKRDETGRFDALALFDTEGILLASSADDHPVNIWPVEASLRVVLLRSGDVEAPPTLRLTVPVLDTGEDVVAYLAGTVPLKGGEHFLEIPEHVAGAIESFILDNRGRPIFVSHPHGHLEYSLPLASPVVRLPPGRPRRYRDREGIEVMGTSAPLPKYGWLFVTEVPIDDALGELHSLRNLSQTLGGFFALLVAAAAWFLAAGIVAPVRRLVAATRRVGAGDLTARVPTSGQNEIGELSIAFNQMAAELTENQARIKRLHNQEIERAEQLATVGELASGVAHEIKNPVVGISNGMDLVVKRVGDDPTLEPIATEMQRQLHRIEDAVRDLLAFARPPSPTLTQTDVNEVVRRALILVEPIAQKAGVAVDTRLAEAVPELQLDTELVRQAVVNLAVNAVQVSPPGEEVRVTTRVDEGGVAIEVRDTGPGIEDDVLRQLFKPFFTTRHSGTGLGLPITRGIVERHGGRLEVETHLGVGTAFTIVLPLRGQGSEEVIP